MQRERIPTAWIKERIRICLEGATDARATAQQELAARLWPATMDLATWYQQRDPLLALYGPDIAEDAAMYAYVRFLETLSDQLERSNIITWLHKTIINFMQREVRRRKAEYLTDDILLFDSPTQEALAETIATRLSLLRALRHMQVDHRHALFLKFWVDLNRRKIARRWHVTAQWVGYVELEAISSLRRAIQKADSKR